MSVSSTLSPSPLWGGARGGGRAHRFEMRIVQRRPDRVEHAGQRRADVVIGDAKDPETLASQEGFPLGVRPGPDVPAMLLAIDLNDETLPETTEIHDKGAQADLPT